MNQASKAAAAAAAATAAGWSADVKRMQTVYNSKTTCLELQSVLRGAKVNPMTWIPPT